MSSCRCVPARRPPYGFRYFTQDSDDRGTPHIPIHNRHTTTMEAELGVPDTATLRGPLQAILTTSSGTIEIGPATCQRPNGRCLVVGRQAATADVRIDHKSISRKHAVLYMDGSALYVKDLGGKYGTAVAGRKLVAGEPIELHAGDTIMFGNVRENVFTVDIRQLAEETPKESTVDDSQTRIEQAGEGLSGRAKRQAEITAMMESLDQTPTYQAYQPPPSTENDTHTPIDEQEKDQVRHMAEQYRLPVAKVFALESESERRNVTTCVAVDPAGARFVTGSSDTYLRFFDFGGMARNRASSFKVIIPEEGHLINAVAYSNTGDRILVGTSSVQPLVVDRDGEEVIKFMRGDMYVADQAKTVGHTAEVTSVDWHPLERHLVLTGSRDGSTRIWNLNGKTQFQMLVCDKVFQPKNARGQRTAVTAVVFHPGGREFAVGTVCGSIQVWNRSRVSGRPERAVFDAHGSKKPITNLCYNMDGSQLASRSYEDDSIKVWNAQRMSGSSIELAKCKGAPTVHEKANTCFSPDGSVLCVGVAEYSAEGSTRKEVGRLNFYQIPTSTQPVGEVGPVLSLDLGGSSAPVVVKWHSKLNQLFVGCSDGRTLVFYDPKLSSKGAKLAASKSGKGEDVLTELLRSKAPQGSSVVSGEILAPFSSQPQRKRRLDEEKDPSKSREPERPATGKHKAGAQAGSNLNFAQFVADQRVKKAKVIAGKDPREALFQYKGDGKKFADSAYEGNANKLADKTAEEEADEQQN